MRSIAVKGKSSLVPNQRVWKSVMGDKDKNKRVLTVIRNPVGGIRTYIKYTYGGLPIGKYQFTILTAKEEEEDSTYLKTDLESQGMRVKLITARGRYINLILLTRIFQTLIRGDFDLIHSQGFTAGMLTVIGNVFTRIPHAITSHDVLRKDQFKAPWGILKKQLMSHLLGKADILQSVGEDAQQNLLEFLPDMRKKWNKLIVIRNGVKTESFSRKKSKAENRLRNGLGVTTDTFLFGFLGRFMPQKGFEYLIEAAGELQVMEKYAGRFRIIAVGEGDYIREYKRVVKEKALSGVFCFYGFVPDVSTVIQELDAVVMPSLWEAYSLLPIEALAMGCPVIATDCIGLREVIHNTPALVARSQDAASLKATMMKYMEDCTRVKKETIDFISTARKRYSITHTCRRLDKLFEEIS
jgi:glycosyltransferase involved in cell wall biosynthesis